MKPTSVLKRLEQEAQAWTAPDPERIQRLRDRIYRDREAQLDALPLHRSSAGPFAGLLLAAALGFVVWRWSLPLPEPVPAESVAVASEKPVEANRVFFALDDLFLELAALTADANEAGRGLLACVPTTSWPEPMADPR